MTHNRSAVILPKDNASVVVPIGMFGAPATKFEDPIDVVPHIVLKHIDGELHRLIPVREGDHMATLERRTEQDISWFDPHYTTTLGDGVATLTDMQAFGFRRDRTPSQLLDNGPIHNTELVEIEPLNLGGLIVDSNHHLPIVLHRSDLSLWRLRRDEEIPEDSDIPDVLPDYAYVIEVCPTGEFSGDWNCVDVIDPELPVATAVEKLGEHAGIEVLTSDCSSEAMEEALDQHAFWFGEATDDEEEQAFRNRLGIQDNTVLFDDEVPDEFSFGT